MEAELASDAPTGLSEPVKVYVGMRNWRPYIPDVVKQMRADGVEEAAVICMAPQNSRTSVGPVSYTHLDVYKRQLHRP